jgi:hypothetical protein
MAYANKPNTSLWADRPIGGIGSVYSFRSVSGRARTSGDWTPRGGPGLSPCTTDGGDDGVSWVVIVDRQAGDDPHADVDAIERLWKQRGLATERYQSGGADPIAGIRGTGGPTTSVDFSADPRGYAVTAESECAEGDYADMVRRQGDAPAG